MKKYWWIISVIESGFVGGESPDDETYPAKKKTVLKLSGPAEGETFKEIISKISFETQKGHRRLDFVWCLGNDGTEDSVLAEVLFVCLKEGPLFK